MKTTLLTLISLVGCLAETELTVFVYNASSLSYVPAQYNACLGDEIDLVWSTSHVHTLRRHTDATCTSDVGGDIESGSTATANVLDASSSAGDYYFASVQHCSEGARVRIKLEHCSVAD